MIVAEIYIEVCWELLFVKVIPLVEKVITVCYCGLEESLFRDVDFVLSLSIDLRLAKLKEMN